MLLLRYSWISPLRLQRAVRKCLGFFFSSRRRHTRSLCDWSSDVCSSDLSGRRIIRSEEHTSELQSRCEISYAVFCLRSEEHTSELQSHSDLVCRLLLEKNNVLQGNDQS